MIGNLPLIGTFFNYVFSSFPGRKDGKSNSEIGMTEEKIKGELNSALTPLIPLTPTSLELLKFSKHVKESLLTTPFSDYKNNSASSIKLINPVTSDKMSLAQSIKFDVFSTKMQKKSLHSKVKQETSSDSTVFSTTSREIYFSQNRLPTSEVPLRPWVCKYVKQLSTI